MYLGMSIYPNPPRIIHTEEEFRMDEVAIGLQWTQESYENLYVSYNVSTEPEIDATVTLISNTHANLALSYNTPYSVSVMADLCGRQATTIIMINSVPSNNKLHLLNFYVEKKKKKQSV